MSVQDKLKQLMEIPDFLSAGVFTPKGELLARFSAPGNKGDVKKVGVLASSMLASAQKASFEMGAGYTSTIHIEAPKAHILAISYNEAADPMRTIPGKAHINLIIELASDAGIGLAKMRLESIVEEIAPEFRF